jgi:hypothetical protein
MITKTFQAALAMAMTAASVAYAQAPQEVGATNREANLLSQNVATSPAIAALPKGTSVRVLERAGGGWMRVDAQGKVGWIRSLQYAPPTGVASGGSGPGLLAALSGAQRAGAASGTTIGARGLTEEDMKNATPNEAELKKLNTFAQSAAQGDQMARNNRLQAAAIALLDDKGKPIAKGSK